MPTPLVEPSDIETALLRPLTDTEATYADGLCAQVSAQLRAKMPSIDARLALPTTDPSAISWEAVAAMLAGVVKRYLVNPTGATSVSETDGPFSQTTGYGARPANMGGGAVGELVITDADLAKLTVDTVPLGATIRTRPRRCVGIWS